MQTKKRNLTELLSFSAEITQAINDKQPILALESTVITHGLPSPTNVDVAFTLENIAREQGVIPATIAILNGSIKIGLTQEEMTHLANGQATKASIRDLAYVMATKQSAGTTVALTAYLAHLAGISLFATGGIGGVHRGDEADISADLLAISQTPVTIISAGPKAILDIPRTLEVLETISVPIVGYQTTCIPAFYSASSQYAAPYSINTVDQLAALIHTQRELQLPSGILVMNPIPVADEIPAATIEPAIQAALEKATARNIKGKQITPFLLAELTALTQGKSLQANIALLKNNVQLGAQLAIKLR